MCYTLNVYLVIEAIVTILCSRCLRQVSPFANGRRVKKAARRPCASRGNFLAAKYRVSRVWGLNVIGTETKEFRDRDARGREKGRRRENK